MTLGEGGATCTCLTSPTPSARRRRPAQPRTAFPRRAMKKALCCAAQSFLLVVAAARPDRDGCRTARRPSTARSEGSRPSQWRKGQRNSMADRHRNARRCLVDAPSRETARPGTNAYWDELCSAGSPKRSRRACSVSVRSLVGGDSTQRVAGGPRVLPVGVRRGECCWIQRVEPGLGVGEGPLCSCARVRASSSPQVVADDRRGQRR